MRSCYKIREKKKKPLVSELSDWFQCLHYYLLANDAPGPNRYLRTLTNEHNFNFYTWVKKKKKMKLMVEFYRKCGK